MRRIAVFLLLLSALPSLLIAQSDLKQRADSLFDAYEEAAALEAYMDVLEESPEQYESLWKASLLHSREGHRKEDEDRQREFYEQALHLADRALDVDSTGAEANFAMAVAHGRMGLISGSRNKVRAAREVKEYADRALESDPNHPGAMHVLGMWNFKVANLNFVERLAANTLFGGLPGDASVERAAELIEQAIEQNPEFIRYYYDLAVIYDDMGREEEAVHTCRQGLKQPSLAHDDPDLKQLCRELIDHLQ